jgi:predicted oxidoreductase
MKTIALAPNLSLSPIVHGQWRLPDWNLNTEEIIALTEQCIELGITTFDHADIYGDYSCETLFGNALASQKSLRNKIQIVTKCGIKLLSGKFPERNTKHYDYSYEYIVSSVNQSLKNLQTDFIDVLLLHRPSPFFNPEEVAKAFSDLRQSGKVLHFGVSNFSALQFDMLNSHIDSPLVTNQIEISPYCLNAFKDGTLDHLQQHNIKPMAWSPLAGGRLFSPNDEKGNRLLECISTIAKEIGEDNLDKVIYKWLLMHPAGILPIVGTGKIERLKNAADACDLELSLEQWFRIYIASEGKEMA